MRLATLAAALGNVDTLIEHPTRMTHGLVPRADCLDQGITEGLVRFSVGIRNFPDFLADLG